MVLFESTVFGCNQVKMRSDGVRVDLKFSDWCPDKERLEDRATQREDDDVKNGNQRDGATSQ